MKPHFNLRKTVKWAGLALTVLLVVAWIGSSRWSLARVTTTEWGHNRWVWSLSAGRLLVTFGYGRGKLAGYDYSFIELDGEHRGMQFWFQNEGNTDLTAVWIPVWAIALPVFLTTAAAWRLDARAGRRTRAELCAKCGYDLSATPAAPGCPECGANAGKTQPHSG